MKIAFISDVHGNYLALDQVLCCLKAKMQISQIYFLGDAIGYMPDANKVISRLKDENIFCLMGNHEAMLLDLLPVKDSTKEVYKLDLTKKTISQENYLFIERLLPSYTLTINNYSVLMIHGNPIDPLNGYLYEDSNFSDFLIDQHQFIFMGHTHRPFILKKGEVTFVNVGSCGLPRDVGHLASFAIFDSENGQVNLYRLPLNIDLIMKEYKEVHPSIIECLLRKPANGHFNGELVK